MHVTTEIGVSYEFVLTAAVMIYEDRVHKREQFATIHKIRSVRSAEPWSGQFAHHSILARFGSRLRATAGGGSPTGECPSLHRGSLDLVDAVAAAPNVLLGRSRGPSTPEWPYFPASPASVEGAQGRALDKSALPPAATLRGDSANDCAVLEYGAVPRSRLRWFDAPTEKDRHFHDG